MGHLPKADYRSRQAELDTGHGAVGFGVSSAEFWFSVPSLCPRSSFLEWYCIFCGIAYWKYTPFLKNFKGWEVTVKRLY